VKSFGTENRPVKIYVAPVSETFEFIIFKAHDIKDLTVVAPPAQTQLHDPAILSVGAQTPAPPQVCVRRTQIRWIFDTAAASFTSRQRTCALAAVESDCRLRFRRCRSRSWVSAFISECTSECRPPLSVPYQQPPLRFQATGHPSADFPMSGTQPQPHPMRMSRSPLRSYIITA
jgi:hypothetical protein